MIVKHVTGRDVYHTTNCQAMKNVTKPIKRITKTQAESFGYDECLYCSGEKHQSHTGSNRPEHIQKIIEELS